MKELGLTGLKIVVAKTMIWGNNKNNKIERGTLWKK